jgi:hypothetical protein
MDKDCKDKIRTILIVVLTIGMIIYLWNLDCDSEPYMNVIDDKAYNPRTNPDSCNVSFRPDTDLRYKNDKSSFQVYDQTNVGRGIGTHRRGIMKNRKNRRNKNKKVRFSSNNVRDVNIKTSHSDTNVNKNRVLDSNNLENHCVRPSNVELPQNETLNIDTDPNVYQSANDIPQNLSNKVCNIAGLYSQEEYKPETSINGIDGLASAVDKYTNLRLDDIYGNYKGSSNYPKKVDMYN